MNALILIMTQKKLNCPDLILFCTEAKTIVETSISRENIYYISTQILALTARSCNQFEEVCLWYFKGQLKKNAVHILLAIGQ